MLSIQPYLQVKTMERSFEVKKNDQFDRWDLVMSEDGVEAGRGAFPYSPESKESETNAYNDAYDEGQQFLGHLPR
jgi:hypothetical protein